MTSTGTYYVSILIEYEKEIVQKEVEIIVGLDFSMDGLHISSEDEKEPIILSSIVQMLGRHNKYYQDTLKILNVEINKWFLHTKHAAIV